MSIQDFTFPSSMRRDCRHCGSTGLDRRSPVRSVCHRCKGDGTAAQLGHFDAYVERDGTPWPDDGCDPMHRYVVNPCVLCAKAPIDWRHGCLKFAQDDPCPHGTHHRHVAGAREPSTREGCREHGMDRDEVVRWWGVAVHDEVHVGVCSCCNGPCGVSQRVPRGMCKRCMPAERKESAA